MRIVWTIDIIPSFRPLHSFCVVRFFVDLGHPNWQATWQRPMASVCHPLRWYLPLVRRAIQQGLKLVFSIDLRQTTLAERVQDGKFIAAGGSGSNEAKIFDRSANNAVCKHTCQEQPLNQCSNTSIIHAACGHDRWSDARGVHIGLVPDLGLRCCRWWRCLNSYFRCGSELSWSLTWLWCQPVHLLTKSWLTKTVRQFVQEPYFVLFVNFDVMVSMSEWFLLFYSNKLFNYLFAGVPHLRKYIDTVANIYLWGLFE